MEQKISRLKDSQRKSPRVFLESFPKEPLERSSRPSSRNRYSTRGTKGSLNKSKTTRRVRPSRGERRKASWEIYSILYSWHKGHETGESWVLLHANSGQAIGKRVEGEEEKRVFFFCCLFAFCVASYNLP